MGVQSRGAGAVGVPVSPSVSMGVSCLELSRVGPCGVQVTVTLTCHAVGQLNLPPCKGSFPIPALTCSLFLILIKTKASGNAAAPAKERDLT